VLWAATHDLLPAYAERFSLKHAARTQLGQPAAVYCYPQPWDAVSFYLRRNDVRSFTADDRGRMMTSFIAGPIQCCS